jgi:eukaryotic-like serine/threonine-protein kinase
LTVHGTILGTPQHMAPELLEGKEADVRTDVFAIGAIVYEMITGRKAFEGTSQASVMTAIMSSEPSRLSLVQPLAPSALDHVVARCLGKDPEQRWQAARDVMLELQWIASGGSEQRRSSQVPSRHSTTEKLAWMSVLALVALTIFLVAGRPRPAPQPLPTVWAFIPPPAQWSFRPNQFAASPDGTRVAFIAVAAEGNTALWIRGLSEVNPRRVDGSEGADAPFWAPDSQHVGFHADGKIKMVDLRSGSLEIVTDATNRGATWNRDGTIVFVPALSGPLHRIGPGGGRGEPVTKVLRATESHRQPWFLPDGRHFLYTVHSPDEPQRNGIYIGSLDGSAQKRILSDVNHAAFASGYLLYKRGGRLLAQSFDLNRLETIGPASVIPEAAVEPDVSPNPPVFSASQTGLLLFQSEPAASQLVWFEASGKELGSLPIVGAKYPRLSPDGRFLAVAADDARSGRYYIRVYDLSREGVSTRLTNGGNETCPVWSPDGKEIAYGAIEGTTGYLNTIAVDGADAAKTLLKGARMVPNDWSSKAQLVFMDFAKGPPQLATFSFRDQSVTPFGAESEAQFAPDADWIAYSGPRGALSGEIFVQRFPGPGGRVQISRAGGGQPRWSRDGRRIFFLAPDKKLMAVNFDRQSGTPGAPEMLFQTRIVAYAYDFFQYDVARDGRFLINSSASAGASMLTMVTGWPQLLKSE